MTGEPRPKRTPDEILHALEEADADDEAERVLALTDQQIDQELATEGIDSKQMRERGHELAENLALRTDARKAVLADGGSVPRAAAPAASIAARAPRGSASRRATWLAIAAAGLAAIAIAIWAKSPITSTGQREDDLKRAVGLREKGRRECAAKEWRACLGDLESAHTLDPAGEGDAVRRDRLAAQAELHAAP